MRTKLSEVSDLIAGYAFKSKDFGENYVDKVIKIANITPPRVDMKSLSSFDMSKYDRAKLQKYIARRGDFVFAMTGATIGKIGRVEEGNAFLNQRVLMFKPHDDVDKDFIYYLLLQREFYQYVLNHIDSESAQPNISAGTVGKYEFELPPYKIQRRIGLLLRAIDEKAENNKRINENLLQQMEALYKGWFVDYIPFGGSRPADWEKSDIYSIADIIYGAPFSSKLFNTDGEGMPIIRIRDLKEQAFVTYTTENHPRGHLIQPGDIVVGMDGEFRPYIWGNTEAWLNQRVCIFDNKRPKGKAFVLFTIKPLLHRIEQTQVATTVIHIGKKDYDAFEFFLPNNDILDQFDEATSPMIDQIVVNCLENKRLAELRDSLLPRLMTGELDVSDIDL